VGRINPRQKVGLGGDRYVRAHVRIKYESRKDKGKEVRVGKTTFPHLGA
jgi:hypothetical protein